MYKHTKKLVAVCLFVTIANLIYSVSHKNVFMLTPTVFKLKFSKETLVGYHHDIKNGFMVIKKQPFHKGQEKVDDQTAQLWQYYNSDTLNSDQDIRFIQGYDYSKNGVDINPYDQNTNLTDIELAEHEVKFQEAFVAFFDSLLTVIHEAAPKVESLNNDEHYFQARQENKYPNNNGRVMVYGGHLRENYLEEPVRTKAMLANYLRLSEEEVSALKSSHSLFLQNMPQAFPDALFEFGHYSHFMRGDGIVYLGGDRYNQLVLLSIKTLRTNGSKLPVEVIIPKRSDFDIDLCLKILPKMNAKCKVMSDYLPGSFIKDIKGYQMKNIALLISSFERILYLDADNLPIKNPDVFFENAPFTNKHLVIWPDLWRRSTSPHFYDIADMKVDETNRVRNSYFANDLRGETTDPNTFNYHDCDGLIPEASSETGQLLINKAVHFRTLMLSMYYNFYGPNYYYALFSQGAAGEGDKETFIAAAHKLKLPYYQVKEFNREFGPINSKSKRHELFGMGQYDPILDYMQSEGLEDVTGDSESHYYNEDKPTFGKNDMDSSTNNYKYHLFKLSSLFFLHANWPKFLLNEMFLQNSFGRGPKDGNRRRRLYHKELPAEAGYDFEYQVMVNVKWCFCDLTNINLKGVPETGSDDRRRICEEIQEQLTFLEENKV